MFGLLQRPEPIDYADRGRRMAEMDKQIHATRVLEREVRTEKMKNLLQRPEARAFAEALFIAETGNANRTFYLGDVLGRIIEAVEIFYPSE